MNIHKRQQSPTWLIMTVGVLFTLSGCGSPVRAQESISNATVEIVSAESARPAGTAVPETPFAVLPFLAEDTDKLRVSSDWLTAEDELAIIGDREHFAIDFEGVQCGRPVVAMADGWAIASFQSGIVRGSPDLEPPLIKEPWKDPYTHREGHLGLAGLFVDIRFDAKASDGTPMSAQIFHLGSVNPSIEWTAPVRKPDQPTTDGKLAAIWTPNAKDITGQDAKRTRVKAGDIIGYMGDTGINHGYDDEFDPATRSVRSRDRVAQPPWDPQGAGVIVPIEEACQIHMEVFTRVDGGSKRRIDPFGMYGQITGEPGTPAYRNPINPQPGHFRMTAEGIFKQEEGRLLCAA